MQGSPHQSNPLALCGECEKPSSSSSGGANKPDALEAGLSSAGFPYTERSTEKTDKPRGRVGALL